MNTRRVANVTCFLLSLSISSAAAAQAGQASGQPSLAAIRDACADDAKKLCAGMQPGGGRIVACLKEHKDSLSDRCKQAAGLPANSNSSSAPSAAGSPATPSSAAAAPSAPAAASQAKPATAPKASQASAPSNASGSSASAGALNVAGEKFTERVITDSEHEGMRAATIHLPEKWTFESKIEWHYDRIEVPLAYSSHAENPDNAEAYFQYPMLRAVIVDVAPQWKQFTPAGKNKPGDRLPAGAIWSAPLPPMQAMAKFIQLTRPNVTNLKWLGQQDLPDLAKALKMDP